MGQFQALQSRKLLYVSQDILMQGSVQNSSYTSLLLGAEKSHLYTINAFLHAHTCARTHTDQ